MLILTNGGSDQQTQVVLGDNRASSTWPTKNISNSNIKVETVVKDTDDYGFYGVKVTAYKAGQLVGTIVAENGTTQSVNDSFTANQSRTYTRPTNTAGILRFYAILQ